MRPSFPHEGERFTPRSRTRNTAIPLPPTGACLPGPASAHAVALARSVCEGSIVSIVLQESCRASYNSPVFATAFAGIALHYFTHGVWLADGQLIWRSGLVGNAGWVCQLGRVCPPDLPIQGRFHGKYAQATLALVCE